ARGHREPHQGTAPPRDRPHQLHQLLGQPVSRPTHRRGVRPDAGVALAGCRYRLCPRPSWHAARTIAEARSSGVGLGTTRRCPSARFLPVSTRLPSSRSSARRGNRLNPFSQFTNSMEIHTGDGRGSPVSPSCKFGIQASELCDSFARPTQLPAFATQLTPLTVVRDKFTNNAG